MAAFEEDFKKTFGENLKDKRFKLFEAMGQVQGAFLEQLNYLKRTDEEFITTRDKLVDSMLGVMQAYNNGEISQAQLNQAIQDKKDELLLQRVKSGRAGTAGLTEMAFRQSQTFHEGGLTEAGRAWQKKRQPLTDAEATRDAAKAAETAAEARRSKAPQRLSDAIGARQKAEQLKTQAETRVGGAEAPGLSEKERKAAKRDLKRAEQALAKARKEETKASKEGKASSKALKDAQDNLKKAKEDMTAAELAFGDAKKPATEGGGLPALSKLFETLRNSGSLNNVDIRERTVAGAQRAQESMGALQPFVNRDDWANDPRRQEMLNQMELLAQQHEIGVITEAEYNNQLNFLIQKFQERFVMAAEIAEVERNYKDGMLSATEYLNAMGSAESRARWNYENPGGTAEHEGPMEGGFGYGARAAVTEDPWTAAAEWEKMGGSMMGDLKDKFKEAIGSMIDGTKSFKEAAADFAMGLLSSMADKMLDYTIDRMFASAFGNKTNKLKDPKDRGGPDAVKGKAAAAELEAHIKALGANIAKGGNAMQAEGVAAAGNVKVGGDALVKAIAEVAAKINAQNIGGGGLDVPAAPAAVEPNKGGFIKRLNKGGMVTGGTGLKDDVPALMQGGEYVIRKNSVKKYGAEFFEALNQGETLRAAKGGYVGKKGHLKATTIREKYLMRTHGDKIFQSMAEAGNNPMEGMEAGGPLGFARGGPVDGMDPGLGPKGRLASERTRPRATDSELSIFKAQYLDPLSKGVRGTSVKGLQRKAKQIGFTHEQVFGPRGTRPQKKFVGGLMMAATVGMSLYGAMNQPDADEIKMAGPEYGSQDESFQSFRQGFGAQARTTVSGGGMGADIRVANATIFEGSDPRQPDSMREMTGVAGRGMTQQEGGIASAQAFDPGSQNPLDQMRQARKESYRKREKDKKDFEERKAAAMQAYKNRRRQIATQAIMSAAFQVGWSAVNSGPAGDPNSTGPGRGFTDPNASAADNFMKVDASEAPYGLTKSGEVRMTPEGNNRGGVIRRAAGGGINPQGKDNIQALLTGGEFVLNPQAVSKIGVHALHKMNAGSYQPGWSAGGTGRNILASRGGHIRGYQSGGLVGPNVGVPAGIDSDGSAAAINRLISTTDSVREAIVGLGATLGTTQQGQAMEQEVMGGAPTNNITFNITVEGNGDVTGGAGGGDQGKDENGNEETRKQEREKEMQEMSASLEMAVLKVILEQKRPGGVLYNPRRPNS